MLSAGAKATSLRGSQAAKSGASDMGIIERNNPEPVAVGPGFAGSHQSNTADTLSLTPIGTARKHQEKSDYYLGGQHLATANRCEFDYIDGIQGALRRQDGPRSVPSSWKRGAK